MRLPLALLLVSAVAFPTQAAVHRYLGLTMAPSGNEVAAIEPGENNHPGIVVRSARDGRVVRRIDPCTTCSYSGLTYAPQGDGLAFLARDGGVATLMIARGDTVRPVATVEGLASTPRFSPDGKRVAMLITLGATKDVGATQAGARQVGEIGVANDEQRLAVVAIGEGAPAKAVPLSPQGRYIYEYDWTPDGSALVVTSALGNGDANWWVATLDRVDATTGAVTAIAKPATQLNMPRVSPDGKTVAYIGGLMSDFGSIGGDVWTVPLAGGTPVNQTKGQPMTFTALIWTKGGLRAATLRNDQMGAVALTPGQAPRPLFARPAGLSAGDGKIAWNAKGDMAASVVEDFTHAPAVYAGRVTDLRQITHDNDAQQPAVQARSVTWTNEGFTVQGWLLSPLMAKPDARAPMIVQVHGGPSAASTPRFIEKGLASAFEDAGYYRFLPNPRGSYGQGEAFTAANKRDFGGGDLRDILAGIDAVEKLAPIDDARLGLTGCSYGGFMVMWANTQTNRFKAIVAGAGLSDWVSYYGTNGINTWMIPFFGKSVYDDYRAYEDVSAVYHVKTARTPTFIYVGERDIEVPPTQSVEWWNALKSQNVPTSLVIYPDAGHCVPTQAPDVMKRQLAWFGKYLGQSSAN
ncbi:S9 family peptidase [Sphingomonas yabuuchiae]|uniref:Dipeptidyl aminopeptidase/acylaminoacyl peptidase n=1 Tax=Sphingomonas yabuuchiae TaxID=172044 RepID=A0AA41A020_9SPHN|nr:prolyl oligopeptidase family serine peptidase [Sphingomonas yabuuchiae]MBB4611019.1 dipeptidyl aminopeptidase/acylaminoacyl peptidase [Sphingomonas yabuuchiae]MBN3558294.1 S9 family peptidase [Sphingomonas yabuuchiae]